MDHLDQVRDHIPLEQGLRHGQGILLRGPGFVRDHIPLEQGLRRNGGAGNTQPNVRDHIPLEQGLRL